MDEITLELTGNVAKSAVEIATLQHVLPSEVANCAVMIGLEILRADQENPNGLIHEFVRSQHCDATPTDDQTRQAQEKKKRSIMDGFGIWKQVASAPEDGLQYQYEVRSEWS